MEENKHKILMTVIGVGTLLVALAGATFAYFSATDTAELHEVTTSQLNLEVKANDATTHVTNIKPTTWSETMSDNLSNKDIAKVHFNVKSTSSAAGTYNVTMTAPRLKLNKGNDAAGVALVGGSLEDVMYKVYKVTGEGDSATYTAVTIDAAASAGNLSTLDTAVEGTITPIQIIKGAAISSTLNDHYVVFVYIQNQTEQQNQLQGLDFDISVTGSASQL